MQIRKEDRIYDKKMMRKKLSSSFEENIAYMDQVLPVKESFDIIKREMEIGGRKSFFDLLTDL